MIEVAVPGFGSLALAHLVLDFNGTLACDGRLLDGVCQRLDELSTRLQVHVLTADTFGRARSELSDIACRLVILPSGDQAQGKLDYVRKLGAQRTVCIGNGRNDRLMLKQAALGIAVVLEEGAAGQTLMSADIVVTSVLNALDLLTRPLRLVATLRS